VESELSKLKEDILDSFKSLVGDAWEQMKESDHRILKDAAQDAALLHLKSLHECCDLSREIRIVNATLLNLSIAKTLPVAKVFWRSVERAATLILSTLVKAGISALV